MTEEQSKYQSIETFYKGYKVRSRLEARWAVILEALGADWEYEPEGFILRDNLQYLPDFVIHNVYIRGDEFSEPQDVYLEVKGNLTVLDKAKIDRFPGEFLDDQNEEGSYIHFNYEKPLLVVGRLFTFEKLGQLFNKFRDVHERSDFVYYSFISIDRDQYPAFLGISDKGNIVISGPDYWREQMNYEKTMFAYLQGLQARFEHGERPLDQQLREAEDNAELKHLIKSLIKEVLKEGM